MILTNKDHRPSIVVLDGLVTAGQDNPGAWDALASLGNLKVYERTAPDQVVDRMRGAFAVFSNKVVIDDTAMSMLPDLKFIGVLATGYNNVDVMSAARHGITVCNVPGYSSDSVVQTVFALLLGLTNRVERYAASVNAGDWCRCRDFSYRLGAIEELAGLTMGVYGLGNIGSKVAAVATAFGMNVISNTSKPQDRLPQYITKVSTAEMLSQSDVLSLNAPLADNNRMFINAESLSLMKPTAILINTARGGLVDEQALAEALKSRRLAGAGLDVLQHEPPADDCPLIGLDNCIITPHVAWQSQAAVRRLLAISAENLKAYMSGQPVNVVC